MSARIYSILTFLKSVFFLAALWSPFAGCAGTVPYTWASEIPAERARPTIEHKGIRPGDVLAVTVVGHPEMSGQFTVGADGTLALPGLGGFEVGGRSVPEGERQLKRRLSTTFTNPEVSLVVLVRNIEVTIVGEVASTGKFVLKSGDGIVSALAMAGGINEFGDKNAIFLIRGSEAYRIRFRLDDLLRGGDSARAFVLRDGDLIVVE